MRARGPLNWDTVAAKKGPRALAIKNRESILLDSRPVGHLLELFVDIFKQTLLPCWVNMSAQSCS